jgi:hypothetical protein
MRSASIAAEDCKVHFACWNGRDQPLDIYLAGEFEEWQRRQRRRNFKRKYVVSLIDAMEKDRWLFAGVHEVFGCLPPQEAGDCFYYSTQELEAFKEFSGRLVVGFERRFRHSYPRLEIVADELRIAELKAERVAVSAFPGFNSVRISHRVLRSIVKAELVSWKSILSNVKGVYCITDRSNGKIYVGSATGEDMIWQRWSAYALTGHGGNKQLREVLDANGPDYARNYQYSILEIADSHAGDKDILARESHWKEVLCTRKFGYNSN